MVFVGEELTRLRFVREECEKTVRTTVLDVNSQWLVCTSKDMCVKPLYCSHAFLICSCVFALLYDIVLGAAKLWLRIAI